MPHVQPRNGRFFADYYLFASLLVGNSIDANKERFILVGTDPQAREGAEHTPQLAVLDLVEGKRTCNIMGRVLPHKAILQSFSEGLRDTLPEVGIIVVVRYLFALLQPACNANVPSLVAAPAPQVSH